LMVGMNYVPKREFASARSSAPREKRKRESLRKFRKAF